MNTVLRKAFCLVLALCLLGALGASAEPPPHTHTYGAWIDDPAATCTAGGRQYQVCSVCNDIVYRDTTALVHSFGAWGPGIPAGCDTQGTTIRTYIRCGIS